LRWDEDVNSCRCSTDQNIEGRRLSRSKEENRENEENVSEGREPINENVETPKEAALEVQTNQ